MRRSLLITYQLGSYLLVVGGIECGLARVSAVYFSPILYYCLFAQEGGNRTRAPAESHGAEAHPRPACLVPNKLRVVLCDSAMGFSCMPSYAAGVRRRWDLCYEFRMRRAVHPWVIKRGPMVMHFEPYCDRCLYCSIRLSGIVG